MCWSKAACFSAGHSATPASESRISTACRTLLPAFSFIAFKSICSPKTEMPALGGPVEIFIAFRAALLLERHFGESDLRIPQLVDSRSECLCVAFGRGRLGCLQQSVQGLDGLSYQVRVLGGQNFSFVRF